MSQAKIETQKTPWWASTAYYVNFEDSKGNNVRKQISKADASLFSLLNKYTKDTPYIKNDKVSDLMNDIKKVTKGGSYETDDGCGEERNNLMQTAIADFTNNNSDGQTNITEKEIKMWYERIVSKYKK